MVKLNWDSHCCSVQFICSIVYDSFQPHGLQHARLPHAIINSRNLLKLMSIELVMPSNHLFLCRPCLLLPSVFPIIRVFSNESVLPIRWRKYWRFSFNTSPSNEYSGFLPFRKYTHAFLYIGYFFMYLQLLVSPWKAEAS